MLQPFSGFGGSVGLWPQDALVDLACRDAHAPDTFVYNESG